MSEGIDDEGIHFEDDHETSNSADDMLIIDEHVEVAPCWRCGKAFDTAILICPYCRASRVIRYKEPYRKSATNAETGSISLLMWLYAGMLASLIFIGAIVRLDPNKNPVADEAIAIVVAIAIVEIFDAILVVIGCVKARPTLNPWWKGYRRAALAWLGGAVMLAAMLAINIWYHDFLKIQLKLPEDGSGLKSLKDFPFLVIVLLCLQPAVFEELFFRYLALGHFRSVMGVHGAVWISSLMFGLAHLGAPLSMPILILLGVFLGYARVSGGTLLLPMVMHFFHNYTDFRLEGVL